MDAAAITSAAQAVHQELVRKLAEQARINRLRDQLRRARPGGPVAWPGTAVRAPGRHADPRVHAQPDAASWLSPYSFFFSPGPAATGGPARPGLDATAGVPGLTGPGGAAALRPPAAPA
jgi:hypothetical protein